MPKVRLTYPLQVPWIIIFAIIILHSIAPIVSRFISTFMTTYALLIIAGLCWVYFISWKLNTWTSRLAPILLVAFINYLWQFNHGDMLVSTYSFLLTFAPVLIAFRYPSLPYRQKRLFFILIAGSFIATLCTSIWGLSHFPGAARMMALIEDADDPLFIELNWLNIGGFEFTYMAAVLYPVTICYLKEKKAPIWVKIAIALLFGYYFRSSEYMTALLAYLVLSSLWFVPRDFSTRSVLTLLVFLLAIFLVCQGFLGDLLQQASSSTDSSILAQRFNYMSNSIKGIDTSEDDVGLRETVLMQSWEGFLKKPLLGNWNGGATPGGHSFVLDFLCLYGLAGLAFLLWMYKRIYDIFYLPYAETPYFGYAMASYFTAIILSVVNTGSHWLELTLIVPMVMSMIPKHKVVHSDSPFKRGPLIRI